MTRKHFDSELQRLHEDILALGSLVENALADSVNILKNRDRQEARRLIAADRQINNQHIAIEELALTLIATQQPMARDMRTLAAALEISTELERIGDYAKGIAKITLMLGNEPFIKPLIDIPRMADRTVTMLHQSLTAFTQNDVALARTVAQEDDEVDSLYNQVYRELFTYVMTDPKKFDQATHLMWVGHNLERAADRVVNICERVVYTVTGQFVELDHESREDSEPPGPADTN
jgi:phosphate transport system protein